MEKDMVLVLHNGEKLPITGEEGKFWICGERRFRKLSHSISGIEKAQIAPAVEEHEESLAEAIHDVKNVVAQADKKKTAPKKKKPATPKAEG